MDAEIIDWSKAPSGNEVEVLSLFYSFKNITEYLARYGKSVDDVKKLMLEYKGDPMLSEVGFREFLKALVSVQWNEAELTKSQIRSINLIQDYLAVPIAQLEQPIVSGDEMSFNDFIKQAREKAGA